MSSKDSSKHAETNKSGETGKAAANPQEDAKVATRGAQLSRDNDIVDLILNDHVTVKEAYQKLKTGKDDGKHDSEKEQVYQKMCWDIAEHAVAEELVFYPMLEKLGKEGQNITAESRADHEKTKQAMSEVDGRPFKEVDAKVFQMVEELIEHMTKEETEDLILTRDKFDTAQRKEAASLFKKAKMFAPKTGEKGANDKQAFESPYALMTAASDKTKEMFDKALPVEGDEGETDKDGGKRYHLRHGHADEGKSKADDHKSGQKTSPDAKNQGSRRSGEHDKHDSGKQDSKTDSAKHDKTVTSPSKNGASHDKHASDKSHDSKSSNTGHKNGSPNKDAGDDAMPPAKRGASGDEHARKKGAAADRGEEMATNE